MSRLKKIREAQGLSQQQVANALGLHITNYNKLENGKTALTQRRMEQLATILHCAPTDFMGPPSQLRAVSVRQFIEAGAWSESSVWDQDDWYEVAVPDDDAFRHFSLYGAETRGPSMNKRYPEGSALIYTSIIETGEIPKVGRRYIVETERPDGLREATVKTLWRDDAGELWLLPESTDPRHQQPIKVANGDGNIVRIVGRVVFAVSRED